MKTRNYYQPSTASLGKKRRVVRRKIGARFFLKLLILTLLAALLVGGGWLGLRWGYRQLSNSQLSTWQAKRVVVAGVSGELYKKLLALAQPYQNKPFSIQDAVALRQKIIKQYPMLKEVAVKRGLFSRKLTVSVKHRRPLAKFVMPDGSSVKYIDADGTIYTDFQPDLLTPVPVVELKGTVPGKLGTEFVELIERVAELNQPLKFKFLQLDLSLNTVKMYMPDGSIIDFGPAVQLKQKATRAAQIIALTRGKVHTPFTLNFQFFEEGKIFLRKNTR